MIEEVQDIAGVFQWRHYIFKTEFSTDVLGKKTHDGELYGISVTPPGCEIHSFTFLSDGRMSSMMGLRLYGKAELARPGKYLYDLFMKIRFAENETHMLVVNLLRYSSRKYFSEFHVTDEGGYWESNDEGPLAAAFHKYTLFSDQVISGIQSIPMNEGESFEANLKRILKRDV